MPRKKVVLFIVEGITDQDSLELLLTEIIDDDKQVIFQVVNGDIISDNSINSSNIKRRITELIKDGGNRKYKASDYKEIVHLVDIDGVFISEENIYEDKSLNKFVYKDDGIYAQNREDVKERNNKKSKLLNLLVSTDRICRSIPYRVFYFSCNLEHVLHNERNVKDELKTKYAEVFQDKYIDNLEGFIKLICDSDFTVKKDYKVSWEFIKENNNSIKRFTNFNILLEDYLN